MSEEVKTEDIDGRDPLPKYIKQSKVWLGPIKATEKERKEQSRDRGQDGSSDNSETATSPTTVERQGGRTHAGT